jgi:hypothetical protein
MIIPSFMGRKESLLVMPKIMILGNERGITFLYQEELNDVLGIDSVSFADFDKAFSRLSTEKFDLFLYDPDDGDVGLDHKEAITRIHLAYPNMPILVASVRADKASYGDYFVLKGDLPSLILKVCQILQMDMQMALDHYFDIGKDLVIERIEKPKKEVKIFICYAREDFGQADRIYRRLGFEKYIPWMDRKNIVGGQDWDLEITRMIEEESNFFLACLSNNSVSKEGYVQKELKKGFEILDKQPEGRIYLIPVRLDECKVPQRLKNLHWVNLFEFQGMENLLRAIGEGCKQKGYT